MSNEPILKLFRNRNKLQELDSTETESYFEKSDATILEVVEDFFEEDEWPYIANDDNSIFKTGFKGENAQYNCYAQIREAEQQFVFYTMFPVLVPEAKKRDIAELIARINFMLAVGNFQLDFNDGQIQYKTSITISPDNLDPSIIQYLIYTNVFIMDRYVPAILAVIHGKSTPVEALQELSINLSNLT